ncbi:double-strand break repair protein AddB [Georhizobium profundi]|uniref:Double-strand break repair protein AddB n=2 Tax=Georhizobium profundi TaxID=2341112 RepID=A0A3Q8XNT3_9HYPH|nr:double-strand break repair protein AddB [Georhizobium profundi]
MAATMQKRLFTIPPGAPLLRILAESLCAGDLVPGFRYDPNDPLSLARATIYLPTRRAVRSLRSEFVDVVGTGSAILPTLKALGELDEDGGFFDAEMPATLDLAPPIGSVEAVLELASLVERWKAALPAALGDGRFDSLVVPATPADAVWLARDLRDLIDAMGTHGGDWAALDALEAADFGTWWQLTLEFMKIARSFWPARLGELSRSDPALHRNAAMSAEIARMLANPPDGPVIVAGSTGSIPATADLIAAIATLEHGAVIFPGLDLGIADDIWPLVGGEAGLLSDPAVAAHPQFGLSRLLDRLDAAREMVTPLGDISDTIAARNRLVSTALLPAQATDHWHGVGAVDPAAFAGVTVIEAGGEREEATALAVAMRLAAENPKQRVALVTPDRNLARRVSIELRRFGIEANDSGGLPLSSTPQGTLLRLLLDTVMEPGDPVALTALLGHPLARFGMEPDEKRRAASIFERIALRGTLGDVDVTALTALLDAEATTRSERRHQPAWRRRISDEDVAAARVMTLRVEAAVAPLAGRFARFLTSRRADAAPGRLTIAQWAELTARVLEGVAADDRGELGNLWGGEAGSKLAGLFADLIAARAEISADGTDWADIAAAFLAGEIVKPDVTAHPRIFIWGALEARLQDVDTLLLAGLNEGSWPQRPGQDPFLSRPMKASIGLEPPERRIGLAAHDFQMALGAKNVVLSRSTRSGGAPTVASRWLQRLLAVAGETEAAAMRLRGAQILAQAALLDHREPVPQASRPEPRPPLEAQPKRYSFSEVKTLRRDPYAIYARKVLRLDPLAELIRDPGVAERGTLYHEVLETFISRCPDIDHPDADLLLESIADECFAAQRLPHHVEVLWRPRFDHVARHWLEWERQRNGEIAERHTELHAEIPVRQTGVLLSGIADRVDLREDGTVDIIDFKSGTEPSRKQARSLLDPQLPLEAAALLDGGFKRVGPRTPNSLKYVRLKPSDRLLVDELEGKDRRSANSADDGTHMSAADLGMQSLDRLAGFIAVLQTGRRGFASRIIPAKARDYGGEYDHLARVAEWANGDADDEEGGEA